jgi:hypothetical protein
MSSILAFAANSACHVTLGQFFRTGYKMHQSGLVDREIKLLKRKPAAMKLASACTTTFMLTSAKELEDDAIGSQQASTCLSFMS